MMKKSIFVAMLLGLLTSPALAGFTGGNFNFGTETFYTDQQVILQSHTGASTGGAFDVYSVKSDGTQGGKLFETFCVEAVTFSPGTKYWVTVDPLAYAGGLSAPGGDPISDVTEWIYDRWLNDTYDEDDQLNIYKAIHYAEQEGGDKTSPIWIDARDALGYSAGVDPGKLANAGHTWAFNLWTITSDGSGGWKASDIQSHIKQVPVPGAVLLGALGLIAAGRKLRRHA